MPQLLFLQVLTTRHHLQERARIDADASGAGTEEGGGGGPSCRRRTGCTPSGPGRRRRVCGELSRGGVFWSPRPSSGSGASALGCAEFSRDDERCGQTKPTCRVGLRKLHRVPGWLEGRKGGRVAKGRRLHWPPPPPGGSWRRAPPSAGPPPGSSPACRRAVPGTAAPPRAARLCGAYTARRCPHNFCGRLTRNFGSIKQRTGSHSKIKSASLHPKVSRRQSA